VLNQRSFYLTIDNFCCKKCFHHGSCRDQNVKIRQISLLISNQVIIFFNILIYAKFLQMKLFEVTKNILLGLLTTLIHLVIQYK
jgi:hypothetical protein